MSNSDECQNAKPMTMEKNNNHPTACAAILSERLFMFCKGRHKCRPRSNVPMNVRNDWINYVADLNQCIPIAV